jgi:uncharacterized protein YjiS (DUF1127 family)
MSSKIAQPFGIKHLQPMQQSFPQASTGMHSPPKRRTVYVQPPNPEPYSVRWPMARRYARRSALVRRQRLLALQAIGAVALVPQRCIRARTRARLMARALGQRWTRADDAAFRSKRLSRNELARLTECNLSDITAQVPDSAALSSAGTAVRAPVTAKPEPGLGSPGP